MYILYKEIALPQTKTKIEKKEPVEYDVRRASTCDTKLEADAWVNKDCEHRSWSRVD